MIILSAAFIVGSLSWHLGFAPVTNAEESNLDYRFCRRDGYVQHVPVDSKFFQYTANNISGTGTIERVDRPDS